MRLDRDEILRVLELDAQGEPYRAPLLRAFVWGDHPLGNKFWSEQSHGPSLSPIARAALRELVDFNFGPLVLTLLPEKTLYALWATAMEHGHEIIVDAVNQERKRRESR